MTQTFVEGKRVPLTYLTVDKHTVIGHKTKDKDGYTAQIIGIGSRKKTSKPITSALKKVGLDFIPRYIREVRTAEIGELKTEASLAKILTPGSHVSVTAISKGKGTAGVIKRHGFAGGPRTHGQSDRRRAPGSIGRGTTPGRVVKGQKMAGHMGSQNVNIRNLTIHSFDQETGRLSLTGPIPGARGTLVQLTVTKKQD